jgi:hypothetical protein
MKRVQAVYWRRQWVIQEVVLASKASVICGDKTLDWRIIRDVIDPVPYICYVDPRATQEKISCSRLRGDMKQKLEASSQQKLIPLLEIVVAYRAAKYWKDGRKFSAYLAFLNSVAGRPLLLTTPSQSMLSSSN